MNRVFAKTAHCGAIRFIFLIVCAFSFSNAFTAQAQTVVCGIVQSDSLDKQTFPITVYLNKALYGGLGSPNFGVVDSTVITNKNAVFSLFLPEPGAYFLCFTGAQASSLGIAPLFIDTALRTDSLRLYAGIANGKIDVSAAAPYQYIADMQRVHRAILTAQMNANKQSSSSIRASVQPSADSTLQASLFQTVVSEHIHPEARKFAAYCLLYGLDREKFEDHASRLETVLSLLPPRSLHWSWGGQNAIPAITINRGETRLQGSLSFLFSMMRENPELIVRHFAAMNLLSMAHYYRNDSILSRSCELYSSMFLHDSTAKFFFGTLPSDSFAKFCADNKEIVAGKAIPDFAIRVLNGKRTASRASMMGKPYLIEFWSMSCSGCLQEIPRLEELYKRHRKQGFEIIAINGEKPSAIERFRQRRHTMPWLHAQITQKEWFELNKKFETFSSSLRHILVDARGKIIAEGADAQGERLQSALERLFTP